MLLLTIYKYNHVSFVHTPFYPFFSYPNDLILRSCCECYLTSLYKFTTFFLSNKNLFSTMENFDYYPGKDFDFDPIFELQNQASGSLDTPHETSTIRKLPD